MLDFLFYPTPCTIDFCPEDIYHWDICQHYVTPEGVPLDICKYSKYVATFYRGRLVAYIHYYDKVLSVEPAADPGTFYVDIPCGANIRIHYDHIEYINGYYDKVVTDWQGFQPKEIKLKAGRPRSGRRLLLTPVAAGARGKRHPTWKKAPRRAADYENGSRTSLRSHSPPSNSFKSAPLRGPPLR